MTDPLSSPPEGHVTPDIPPTPKSYANVAGSSSSSQINLSFDPKKIVPIGISENEEGQKALSFSSLETDRLAAAWRLTLIGKFSFAIPHAQAIAKGLSSLGIKGPFSWSFANHSHIIIKLQVEEDYTRLWMETIWMIGECPMRILKWTPDFNPKMEAPLAPVWIRLPGLPIQFFDYHALYAICKELGNPLQVDLPTACKTRLSLARVCLELNLQHERTEEIILKFGDTMHVQKIIYERVPSYCNYCKHIGHGEEDCYMNGNKAKPPPPVRRPGRRRGVERMVPGGNNGDMNKAKGTLVNSNGSEPSKNLPSNSYMADTGNPEKTPSNQTQWVEKNKGSRVTGFLNKEVMSQAKKTSHIYFDSKEDSSHNQFSILECHGIEPSDDPIEIINVQDQSKGSNLPAKNQGDVPIPTACAHDIFGKWDPLR
ncbi:hypothetical protein DH2020_032141 [Rehmannia glutinosa]|uniref:DUF4283 domain-containing protein n=1 Tax=Rehmannia glutinosa TaxID=99300 RepID=A0ABR0VIG8_REHGL